MEQALCDEWQIDKAPHRELLAVVRPLGYPQLGQLLGRVQWIRSDSDPLGLRARVGL